MQQIEPALRESGAQRTWDGVERRRVETVVETLAALGTRGESLAEVAHDARNMVAALGLYCDLLMEPGVLAIPFAHYADELRLVAAASCRLVEKLVALDSRASDFAAMRIPQAIRPAGAAAPRAATSSGPGAAVRGNSETFERRHQRCDLLPSLPVANLAAELRANRNLLAALAGPSVALTIETEGGAQAVWLSAEDLTRLLVNLVKNAAEAMLESGRIHISLKERAAGVLSLCIEDNGPGIPVTALEEIFTSGYTSHSQENPGGWPKRHRGLGLSIVRSIVEGAGGRITAANRAQGGACFTLALPARKTGIRDQATGNRL